MSKCNDEKKSFVLYTDFNCAIQEMPDDVAGKLIKAIYFYVETGEQPEIEESIRYIFLMIKQHLDKVQFR